MDFLFRAYQVENGCGCCRDLRIDAMDELVGNFWDWRCLTTESANDWKLMGFLDRLGSPTDDVRQEKYYTKSRSCHQTRDFQSIRQDEVRSCEILSHLTA